MWIDTDESVGTIGFLVEVTDNNNGGATRFVMSDRPCCTNMSHEPRLTGWCGETNNISRQASGLVKVVRRVANGRAMVEKVKGREGAAWLTETAGFPDLIPDGWTD